MSESFLLREATEDDISSLITFGRQEFERTFSHLYPTEDLQIFLEENYNENVYESWLKDDDNIILIAYNDNNEILGSIVTGKNTLPLQHCGYDDSFTSDAWEIKRLYVHPSTFGLGLGGLLLKKSFEWLNSRGHYANIFLGVYSENHRALKFYAKHNFEKIGEHGFVVGKRIDNDFICHWKGFKDEPL
jgi:ribosomal protein S18 acetylase RimI-like enzyme